ncbi:MAG: hypothetical protein RMK29_09220 [Myxococcales bacterium]|nr:hypothetical protein [Myxococcota bacterium]MDW8281879.1 hypothetical protein [Myxococcales bacterium]
MMFHSFGRRDLVRLSPCVLLLAAALGWLRCNAQLDGGLDDDPALRGDGGTAEDARAPGERHLVALRIAPDNEVLLVDLRQQASRTYTVTGLYSDRTTEDLTDRVTLTADNAHAGQMMGATFRSAVSDRSRVEFTRIQGSYEVGGRTLVGVAHLTVVWLRQSGPSQDFFFSLPYQGPAQQKPLSFTTFIQSLDSFFAVDTTGSMGPSIVQLRDSLQNTIIPGVKAAAVKEAWFGVGAVEDFPVVVNANVAYGQPNWRPGLPDDQPFILLQPMAADVNAARTAVAALLFGNEPRGNGRDLPEAQIEALYQIATGEGNIVPNVVNIPPRRMGIGGVGFREGALPVVTLITDAIFHTRGEPGAQCTARDTTGRVITIPAEYGPPVVSETHTRAQAVAALNKICAKVIGVSVLRTSIPGAIDDPAGICNATQDLMQMARDTGALVPPEAWDLPMRPAGCPAGRCCTGLNGSGEAPDANGLCPLVFKIPQNGTGLGVQVTSGITQLARFATFDVVASTAGRTQGTRGEMLPPGKTTADFIKSVLPLDAMPPPPPPNIKAPVVRGTQFTGVTPGSVVRFTVEARNDFLPQTQSPQVFHATIRIRAGGCADLDERDVIILIPPASPNLG